MNILLYKKFLDFSLCTMSTEFNYIKETFYITHIFQNNIGKKLIEVRREDLLEILKSIRKVLI